MHEHAQQELTAQVIHELAIDPVQLWVHYLGVGGNDTLDPVLAYIEGSGTLSSRERDMLSCAVNDLTVDPPGQPRAPFSYSDTDFG